MTKYDTTILLNFINRMGMYIHPIDLHSIANFIHGYELGRNKKCKFLESLKILLLEKYKIEYLSDGWQGQINRLAEKKCLDPVTLFKELALEILVIEK